MKKLWNRRRRREVGQAAVETAIVMPLLVMTILGILQLTMIQQARLMLEYAAFNAARAGIVWNMDPEKMRAAATLSLMPTLPALPLLPEEVGHTSRVDSLPRLALQYGRFHAINEHLSSLVLGQRAIDVEVLNPRKADFEGQLEIEFDKTQRFEERRKTQLSVRVTYLFELRVPFANYLLFESWMAGNAGLGLSGLNPSMPKVKMGWSEFEAATAARFALEAARFKRHEAYSGLSQSEFMRLVFLALRGDYFLPLVTTYTMRMQSNPYADNAPR